MEYSLEQMKKIILFFLESKKGINYQKAIILIESKNIKIKIQEEENTCEIINKKDDSKQIKNDFKIILQSNLTHLVIEKILNKGDCDLIKFEESSHMHKILLKSFIEIYNNITNKKNKNCPIT